MLSTSIHHCHSLVLQALIPTSTTHILLPCSPLIHRPIIEYNQYYCTPLSPIEMLTPSLAPVPVPLAALIINLPLGWSMPSGEYFLGGLCSWQTLNLSFPGHQLWIAWNSLVCPLGPNHTLSLFSLTPCSALSTSCLWVHTLVLAIRGTLSSNSLLLSMPHLSPPPPSIC